MDKPTTFTCTPAQREVLISALQIYQAKLYEEAMNSAEGARDEALLESLVASSLGETIKEYSLVRLILRPDGV